MVLFVHLIYGEGEVSSLGAGSTDEGLTARAAVFSGN
jgi:hypothetical protein